MLSLPLDGNHVPRGPDQPEQHSSGEQGQEGEDGQSEEGEDVGEDSEDDKQQGPDERHAKPEVLFSDGRTAVPSHSIKSRRPPDRLINTSNLSDHHATPGVRGRGRGRGQHGGESTQSLGSATPSSRKHCQRLKKRSRTRQKSLS